MTCITIPSGIICVAKVEFLCPHCGRYYVDIDDEYLKKCNKNKSGYTKIKCTCGEKFGFTYDIKGNATSFKLK